MRFFIFLLFSVFLINQSFSQSWSEPINIDSDGINKSPSLAIDLDGVLHCVWTKVLDYSYNKIFYSRSTDDGLTWTPPISLTNNSNLRLEHPHIASDSYGNLYVSYDYDVNAYPDVKIHYLVFTKANSSWSQPIEIGTGTDNRIVIDRNDRVYFFWFAGTEQYAYLESNMLSQIYSLGNWFGEACYLNDFHFDTENKLHCIGNRKAGDYSRGAYFSFYNGEWSPYMDLMDYSFYESGLCLNSIGEPSFVWEQLIPENHSFHATYFSRIVDDSVQPSIQLAKKTDCPSICIDQSDKVHIVDSQDHDSIFQLTYRYQISGVWNDCIIEENIYKYDKTELLFNKPYVYLAYNRIDPASKTNTDELIVSGIVLRRLEIPQSEEEFGIHRDFVVYPNPFTETVTFEWGKLPQSTLSMNIYKLNGQVLFSKNISPRSFQGNKYILSDFRDKRFNRDDCIIVKLSGSDFERSIILFRVK